LPILLDCTFRDGGYYTAWDFDQHIVAEYIKAINELPIDYVELGYRNNPQKEYMGKFSYCPDFVLADIRNKSTKKLAIMLNEKNVRLSDLEKLLDPITEFIDMVRIAVDPDNFDRAIILAADIKKRGVEVSLNTMYMSKWREYNGFFDKLANITGIADVFYMVDSFGSISPADLKEILEIVKEKTNCSLGFHGHNNLELGLINTITAIDNGVNYVDATILGMGRGAGNLKTELLLTYLNKHYNMEVDFNTLGDVITAFFDLFQKYKWGTNLPYMISGANSLPQKDIMEWTNNRWYPFNDIVRALNNKKAKITDNAKYPILQTKKFDCVIIVGGGTNAAFHADGIKAFIRNHKSIVLIHATARNAVYYQDMQIPQYFCIAGNESKRLGKVFADIDFNGTCILPPHPRIMGTNIPEFAKSKTFELAHIDFTDNYSDFCTTMALQAAAICCTSKIFIVGYDGYTGNILSEKEMALSNENRFLFTEFQNYYSWPLISLTPTLYKELMTQSLYQYV
jgi:4-hydroxy 2-oxovalerate aldolase